MFGYRGAAECLKSLPCERQEYAKNPTLCRTTASISLPCLGHATKCTLTGFASNCLISHGTGTICSVNVRLV